MMQVKSENIPTQLYADDFHWPRFRRDNQNKQNRQRLCETRSKFEFIKNEWIFGKFCPNKSEKSG